MTSDQIHQGFHRYFNGQLTPTQRDALFTAAEHAGYLHLCTSSGCPKGLNHE